MSETWEFKECIPNIFNRHAALLIPKKTLSKLHLESQSNFFRHSLILVSMEPSLNILRAWTTATKLLKPKQFITNRPWTPWSSRCVPTLREPTPSGRNSKSLRFQRSEFRLGIHRYAVRRRCRRGAWYSRSKTSKFWITLLSHQDNASAIAFSFAEM